MFRSKRRIQELEEEVELLKVENEMTEEKLQDRNDAIREIYRLLNSSKKQNMYGEAGYRDIFRQINELIEKNVEKKLFADGIYV